MLSLLSAGSNARGQLATGTVDDAHVLTPCLFSGCRPGALPAHVSTVLQIACGSNHTLALVQGRGGRTELWGCGDGSKGQLGPSYSAAIEKGSEHSTAIFRPLDLCLEDVDVEGPRTEYTVRLIAAGWETSYVVLSHPERDRSDTLLSMGANDYGNLGIGLSSQSTQQVHVVDLRARLPTDLVHSDSALSVLSLSAGPHHTVVRIRLSLADGWGTSRHGQLGPIFTSKASGKPQPFTPYPHLVPLPSPADITAIALGTQHTVYLSAPVHKLAGLGSSRKNQLSGLATLDDVEQVACTWNGTYALLRGGDIAATGSNTHSQLGRSPQTDAEEQRASPAVVEGIHGLVEKLVCGSEHVLCIVRNRDEKAEEGRREVWGWGWNEHGNLGLGVAEDASVPTRIWPSSGLDEGSAAQSGSAVDVWAGCGTSWILLRR
ncbi:regulator of chromosome condensation 1/beta-lactamase-inhibitor protein II [Daedaleopsis nitida]|nr:regulator of chromosome condensation 1/beta-lactamase-inhibitor protein II [Daedaleopsis nitida]